ncbi:hypothetical protein [Serratia ficaria]|uniref:hypothetical protein n=1 Tax=Serratia ficaria TaxID=61651 RepID=UPI00077C7BFD|nr:hypothetical protein [Serratia ficaria]
MTLTTEQIEQVIDDCRKGAAMRGLFNKWLIEEMASELLRCRDRLAELSALANREAQPVAVMYKDGSVLTKEECGNVFDICCKVETPLFTAPPAPAVPEVLEKLLSIVRSPRALPRRKEWISGQQYSYVLLENVEAMIEDACRAAMLEPVSQDYTLPPHVFRELVNSLRDTAVKHQGTQQLREQLSRTLKENGLSAAAPEGGNGA